MWGDDHAPGRQGFSVRRIDLHQRRAAKDGMSALPERVNPRFEAALRVITYARLSGHPIPRTPCRPSLSE